MIDVFSHNYGSAARCNWRLLRGKAR